MLLGVHWAGWITYAVIFGWLAPAILRGNSVAFILLAAWAANEFVYTLTGDLTPIWFYFLSDAAVICLLVTSTQAIIRAIVLIYVFAMWPVYVMGLSPRAEWFALWALNLAQFVLAGWPKRTVSDDVGGLGKIRRPMDWTGFDSSAIDLPFSARATHPTDHRARREDTNLAGREA